MAVGDPDCPERSESGPLVFTDVAPMLDRPTVPFEITLDFGPREPTFMLCASDPFALSAMGEWLRQSYLQKGNETTRAYAESVMLAFVAWQENVTNRRVESVEAP